jgi:rhodanese-related sulfurtransferase
MQVKEIDVQDLVGRLESGESPFHLVDIRSVQEVAHGCLPEAQHLPMHLLPLRITELPRNEDVILYCRSGARSYHACTYLQRQGFGNVFNLRGGVMDWVRNGFSMVAKPAAALKG